MKLLNKAKWLLNYYYFLANGKKPWTRGYYEYKFKQITNSIKNNRFNLKELEEGYGFRLDERIIEYPWLFSILPPGPGNLLDAGSALNNNHLLSLEPLRSKKIYITTLAPEDVAFWQKGISYTFDDLRDCCYKDNYFNYVISISTLEHIGLDNTMLYTDDISKKEELLDSYLLVVDELNRVLKPGGRLYISVPYGRYKKYQWLQIFDDRMLDQLITAFAPITVNESLFRYEHDGWKVSSREASKEATYFDIHQQINYDEDYAAGSRAVACIEMIKRG